MTEEKKVKPNTDNKNKNKEKIPGFFRPPTQGNQPGNKPKFNIYWVYGLVALGIFALQFLYTGTNPVETNWRSFKNTMLIPGDVEKVIIVNGKTADIYIKPDRLSNSKYNDLNKNGSSTYAKTGPHYFLTVVSAETFEKKVI